MGNWTSQQETGLNKDEKDNEHAKMLASRTLDIPEDIRQNQFHFENLALEGGGTKTYAFLGSLKVLEDLGVLQGIKRFAGTSGGAIICALLSVGCSVEELYDFFSINLVEISGDAKYGYWSLIPNMLYHFGWHPGVKVKQFFQDIIEKKTGNGNITFKELYKARGVELCICVSNVTRMTLEFCHPKTTPDMPVCDAIRMSTSLPLFYQPFKYNDNYYVDGGVLCNYPVFAFDGWYLSMKPEDAFLCKLGGDQLPFAAFNEKTVGMLVYATGEAEMLRTILHARYRGFKLERPDTPLARDRQAECDRQLKDASNRDRLVEAAKRFLKAMHEHDMNKDGKTSLEEFLHAVKALDKKDIKLLFNKDFVDETDFAEIDGMPDNELTFEEFMQLMDRKGVAFRQSVEGHSSCNKFTSIGDFTGAVLSTMTLTLKKLLFKPQDLERTIGVHTDYIHVTDFNMTDKDREFMVKLAEHATIAFLREHMDRATKQQELSCHLHQHQH